MKESQGVREMGSQFKERFSGGSSKRDRTLEWVARLPDRRDGLRNSSVWVGH